MKSFRVQAGISCVGRITAQLETSISRILKDGDARYDACCDRVSVHTVVRHVCHAPSSSVEDGIPRVKIQGEFFVDAFV